MNVLSGFCIFLIGLALWETQNHIGGISYMTIGILLLCAE